MNDEEEQDDGNDMNGMFEKINGNLDNLETRFEKSMNSGSLSSKASVDREHFKEQSELLRTSESNTNVTLQSFDVKSTLGRGAFGRVYLA